MKEAIMAVLSSLKTPCKLVTMQVSMCMTISALIGIVVMFLIDNWSF